MADDSSTAELAQRLQGRIDALSSLSKCLLTAVIVRGLLTKEETLAMIEEAGGLLQEGSGTGAAHGELAAIAADIPARLRTAAHPRASDHHDNH